MLLFANLLKKLLPEGCLYTKDDHYIFKINENYFDYRGLIFKSGKIIMLDDLINEDKLIKVTDLNYEYCYNEITGIISEQKDYVWKQLEDNLYKQGLEFLTAYYTKENHYK